MINLTNFSKLDLRTGIIRSVEKIENTAKLYKIMVDIGNGGIRQVVSGLAESYTIEELANKSIVLLANLEPKNIKGVESQGMLLAASDENHNISLIILDKNLPPGNKVR